MPGYNHYPSCTCGWCINYGRSTPIKIAAESMAQGRATTLLREYGADRSRAACFISHNARCPVCNARVFYYQNEHGSRVFFDELAPLWTKHPCTDSRKPLSGASRGLSFQPRGIVIEIREAYARLNLGHDLTWRLGIVESIEQTGAIQHLRLRFMSERDATLIKLTASGGHVEVGDVVGIKGAWMSFFDRVCGEARIIDIREPVLVVRRQPTSQDVRLQGFEAQHLARGSWEEFVACWRRAHVSVEMNEDEIVHFHAGKVDVAQFAEYMRPKIEQNWRSDRRNLAGLADALNNQETMTCCGLRWTPRRVYLLLKLIYADVAIIRKAEKRGSPPPKPAPKFSSQGQSHAREPIGEVTREQLLKLSRLGRVRELSRK